MHKHSPDPSTSEAEIVDQALSDEATFDRKSSAAPGKIRKQINQLRLFRDLLRDYRGGSYRKLPWLTVSSLAAAVLYFLNPLDLIPDFIFGVGLLDDAGVIALAFKAYRHDLARYVDAKGLDPVDYF